jgi:hypothetical protein
MLLGDCGPSGPSRRTSRRRVVFAKSGSNASVPSQPCSQRASAAGSSHRARGDGQRASGASADGGHCVAEDVAPLPSIFHVPHAADERGDTHRRLPRRGRIGRATSDWAPCRRSHRSPPGKPSIPATNGMLRQHASGKCAVSPNARGKGHKAPGAHRPIDARGSRNVSKPRAGSTAQSLKTAMMPIRSATSPRPATARPPSPNAKP